MAVREPREPLERRRRPVVEDVFLDRAVRLPDEYRQALEIAVEVAALPVRRVVVDRTVEAVRAGRHARRERPSPPKMVPSLFIENRELSRLFEMRHAVAGCRD